MVQFIRQMPSRRLAILCAALIAVVVGGTALALAASSGGPVPPRKPLANAVHDAITAPEQDGVTARVSFKNNLLSGIDLRGSNPILTGADGRLWATRDGHFRLELQATGGGGDTQVVSDGKTWWVYDGSSNTVYRGSPPQDRRRHHDHGAGHAPSVSQIQQRIDQVMRHAAVSGPTPGDIAGQPAYTVRMSPRRDGGLLGALELGWDANNGVPLRAAVYARGDSSPVIELAATDISFGPVDPSVFDVAPPAGAKTQNVAPRGGHANGAMQRRGRPVQGLATVRRRVGFQLSAPSALAGRTRSTVALLRRGDGAVITYGRGLSGIAVVERKGAPNGAGPLGRARLPGVSIGGTQAQELSTPLGTVLRFERGGVTYVVAGSAPKAVVEAAARGL